ncbi:MAG: NADPH-dependent F420 reductase [Gaiellaceae bacterium]
MKVAVVGGTGSFGRALLHRLRLAGVQAAIGSRDPSRAQELGAVYGVEGGRNEDVVTGVDLVVLAVRSSGALATAHQLVGPIGSTPVLCVASDLTFTEEGVFPGRLGRSLAEEVADILSAPVAAGLQSLAAAQLTQPEPPDQDVLVCGDDMTAKGLALSFAGVLVRGRAIDAGPLANARALEGMTAIILHVNRRYGGHAGIRFTGIP